MTTLPKYEPAKRQEDPPLNFGEGPSRLRNWARYILANPGKFNTDAERAARAILHDGGGDFL